MPWRECNWKTADNGIEKQKIGRMTINKRVRDTENNGMKDVRTSLVAGTVILILVVAMDARVSLDSGKILPGFECRSTPLQ